MGKNRQRAGGQPRVRGRDGGGVGDGASRSLHRRGQRRRRVRDREAERRVPGPPPLAPAGARRDSRGLQGSPRQCAAAAESIRGAGMHLPPWRRARYVQAKWSAPYERVAAAAPPEGARTAPSGGRKRCGMEIGRREMAIGKERLVPFFRGL